MKYSSLLFIYVFLPVSLIIYYIIPKKHREKALLVLSMLYCAADSLYYLIFMILFTLLNFIMCRITDYLRKQKSIAEVALASTIILDITLIFGFRAPYMTWFAGMIRAPEGFFPAGVSIYALSAIGTLIDVYKGREKAESNIIRFALYTMFFPRLIIGPIMRYSAFRKMMKQSSGGLEDVGAGLMVFVKGLAKKVLATDWLYTLYIAIKSTQEHNITFITAWMGAAAYLLCLYFEFSGFADMGKGMARCFGVHLPKCFNYPVFSRKVRLFARRWNTHAVLWFRFYIANPLSAQGKNKAAKTAAYLFAWALLGFWYTFDLNGCFGGIFLGLFILFEKRFLSKNVLSITGIAYTFIVASIMVVIMSCSTLSESLRYIGYMLGTGGFADSQSLYFIKSYALVLLICAFAATDLFRKLLAAMYRNKHTKAMLMLTPAITAAVLVICTAFLAETGSSELLMLKL